MKLLAISLAALFWFGTATAQDEPEITPAAQVPERFMSVTAENGLEWIEQCEWPAQKSDSMTRIAACLSFLQGAHAIASKASKNGNCPVDFSAQSRGALLTTTYQIARRYPRMPISRIFRLAIDSVESGAC